MSLRRQWLLDLEQENSLRMQEVKPSPESSKSKSPSAVGSPPKKGAEEAHDVNSFLHADSATLGDDEHDV